MEECKYIAFISYKHDVFDSRIASRIHSSIERYHIPKDYREKYGSRRLGRVFRDEEELPVSPDLSSKIKEALDQSRFLIVICTPRTPGSEWAQREITYFLKNHDREHIIAVLAEGTPDVSFPPALYQTGEQTGAEISEKTIEPLAANLTDAKGQYSGKRFKRECMRIYAAILDCSYDSLWQRERRYFYMRLVCLLSMVLFLAILFGAVLLYSYLEIRDRDERIQAQNRVISQNNIEIRNKYNESLTNAAKYYSNECRRLLETGDRISAMKLALEVYPDSEEDRYFFPEFYSIFAEGTGAYDNPYDSNFVSQSPGETAKFIMEEDIDTYFPCKDGSCIAVRDRMNHVAVFNIEDKTCTFQMDNKDEAKILQYGDDGILVVTEGNIQSVDMKTGKILWTRTGNYTARDVIGEIIVPEDLVVLDSDSITPDVLCLKNRKVKYLYRKAGDESAEFTMPERSDSEYIGGGRVSMTGGQKAVFGYYGKEGAGVYILDLLDGQFKKSAPLSGTSEVIMMASDPDGNIIASLKASDEERSGLYYASIDPETGDNNWIRKSDNTFNAHTSWEDEMKKICFETLQTDEGKTDCVLGVTGDGLDFIESVSGKNIGFMPVSMSSFDEITDVTIVRDGFIRISKRDGTYVYESNLDYFSGNDYSLHMTYSLGDHMGNLLCTELPPDDLDNARFYLADGKELHIYENHVGDRGETVEIKTGEADAFLDCKYLHGSFVNENGIILMNDRYEMMCISPEENREKWTAAPVENPDSYESDSVKIIGDTDEGKKLLLYDHIANEFIILDIEDGTFERKAGPADTSGIDTDDLIYIFDDDVFCIKKEGSGIIIRQYDPWRMTVSNEITLDDKKMIALNINDNTLLVTDDKDKVLCVDCSTGSSVVINGIEWKDTDADVYGISGSDVILMTQKDGEIYIINTENAEISSVFDPGIYNRTAACLYKDEAWVITDDDMLHCYDARNGAAVRELKLDPATYGTLNINGRQDQMRVYEAGDDRVILQVRKDFFILNTEHWVADAYLNSYCYSEYSRRFYGLAGLFTHDPCLYSYPLYSTDDLIEKAAKM